MDKLQFHGKVYFELKMEQDMRIIKAKSLKVVVFYFEKWEIKKWLLKKQILDFQVQIIGNHKENMFGRIENIIVVG